jgi:predicted PhzF superfamily epimerase YddE/YHI9
MADSGEIDKALVAKLASDATLLGYMPNGVYWDEAAQGSTRFVIVSLVNAADVQQFGGRDHEDALYLVEARALSTASANIAAAAARIDALLDNETLTIAGYRMMLMQRESRIRLTEVDDVDPSIRWYRRGGQYRVMAAPAA